MARVALGICVLAATVIAAGGCGAGGDTTVTVNRTVVQPATGTGATAPTASTQSTGSTRTTATAPPATPTEHLSAFSSPTGNIGCVMGAHFARCDIRQRSWKPPRAPSDCRLDYGQGVEVSGPGKGHLVCAGDTALGATKKLAYGHVSKVGPYLCTSETTGMQCGNSDTGHGFTISSQGYSLF